MIPETMPTLLALAFLVGLFFGVESGYQERKRLHDELNAIKQPQVCRKCGGRGRRLAPIGGYFPHASRLCLECNGTGQEPQP